MTNVDREKRINHVLYSCITLAYYLVENFYDEIWEKLYCSIYCIYSYSCELRTILKYSHFWGILENVNDEINQ